MSNRSRAVKTLLASAAAGGLGWLVYGALVDANRLSVDRHRLALPYWPERLRGFKIALLADFHLRGPWSLRLAKEAVAAALVESPDMVVLAGDIVSYWWSDAPRAIGELLEPLLLMEGSVVAVPGNHEYHCGSAEFLRPILDELNIKFLRNESWEHKGITWVGVDSAIEGLAKPAKAMCDVLPPAVCVWHEPDLVHLLPPGCSVMLSGHTHGGQWTFPGGFTPMYTKLGSKYPRGFYPHAPTPLYVTRGIGTTGPPSRFNCAPEVAILTLVPL